MFEPLLSLNPQFGRTTATSLKKAEEMVAVAHKTMLPRDPAATTGQIHATSVRFQGFLGHDFHLTSKDYTYLNILAMFTMEPKTGYEVAPIIGKLPN